MTVEDVHPVDARPARHGRIVQHPRLVFGQALAPRQQLIDLARHHAADHPAARVCGFVLGQKDQLVGAQGGGHRAGDVGGAEVEHLTGRRVAERRYQGDAAAVELAAQRFRVDPPHLAGVAVVDTVDHAQRLGGDEVAGDDANPDARHRRICQPHRQQRLDLDPHHAVGLLDAGQAVVIGDAQAIDDLHVGTAIGQLLLDLRPRARHQHQAYPEAVEQRDVVDQVGEAVVGNRLTAERQHEHLAAMRVDIG